MFCCSRQLLLQGGTSSHLDNLSICQAIKHLDVTVLRLKGAVALAVGEWMTATESHSPCRMGLDVMRVDSPGQEPCFSVCYAAYGYMADLVRSSESLRCLGSLRYGLAGAMNLLRGRSYQAKIHYLPSNSRSPLKSFTPSVPECSMP